MNATPKVIILQCQRRWLSLLIPCQFIFLFLPFLFDQLSHLQSEVYPSFSTAARIISSRLLSMGPHILFYKASSYGGKLFAVGTTSSLVGTAVTNALIKAGGAVDNTSEDEINTGNSIHKR